MTQPKAETKDTGTTTLGLVCSDGVILAADNRTTMGNLIAKKDKQKVRPLTDYMGMTMAGSVGDAQMLERMLKTNISIYEIQRKKRITVEAITTFLANTLQERSYFPYWVQILIGGYDNKPTLFDCDPVGGYSEQKDYAISGSGSVFAVGVLEDKYKPNKTMKENEELALRAIHAAIERDTYSGNGADILFIGKDKSELKHYTLEEIKKHTK